VCLLRGTDWMFSYSSSQFQCYTQYAQSPSSSPHTTLPSTVANSLQFGLQTMEL